MKKMYTIALLLVIILFVSNRKKEEVNVDNTLDNDPSIGELICILKKPNKPLLSAIIYFKACLILK